MFSGCLLYSTFWHFVIRVFARLCHIYPIKDWIDECVVRLGLGFKLIRAILLQAANMQQDDEIRVFRGKAHSVLAKTVRRAVGAQPK